MKKLYVLSLLVVMCLVQPIYSQVTFSDTTNFATQNYPFLFSKGDINGDGKPDLAIIGGTTYDKVSVHMNSTSPGASKPTFAAIAEFATGYASCGVSIKDLNGDGKPDLAVTNIWSNDVSLFLNTTTPGSLIPTFATRQNFAIDSLSRYIFIEDLNGDGKSDLVMVSLYTDSIGVLINTTTPGSATPSFTVKKGFKVGDDPANVIIDDFNGDGRPDLVTTDYYTHNVSVLMNMMLPGATVPAFGAKTDIETRPYPNCIASGDLNGDGKPDLATTGQIPAAVSVMLNTTTPGAATPTFSTHMEFTTGTAPGSVSIKDLNGDGKQDLVVANQAADSVSVILNTTPPGSTTPTFANKLDFAVGDGPISVLIDDLNGDYKQDIIVTNSNDNNFSILLNTTNMGVATPSFSASADFNTDSQPNSISSGDLNSDGMSDMIVTNVNADSISIFLNTTTPGATVASFSAKSDFPTGTSPRSALIKDFNGDGNADVAFVNNSNNSISIYINTTSPGAAAPSFSTRRNFSTASGPASVCSGDFNGDGMPDLAAAIFGTGRVSILLNTTVPGATIPTFSTRVDSTTGSGSDCVSTTDLNADGKLDLVVANQNANSISVLFNTTATGATSPTFTYRTNFDVGSSPRYVSICDLNGDGMPDLVTANYSDNSVSVLLNTTTPGTMTPAFSVKTDFTTGNQPYWISIGDLNGDCVPDLVTANGSGTSSVLLNLTTPGASTPAFSAKTDFTGGTGPRSVAIDDFNGDGMPDLALANFSRNSVSVLLNTAVLPTGVEMKDEYIPSTFGLDQNYPNPFNPSTRISFTLTNTEYTKLVVYNLLGQQVKILFDGIAEKLKEYAFDFDASSLASGVYFYKMQTSTRIELRKMLLIK